MKTSVQVTTVEMVLCPHFGWIFPHFLLCLHKQQLKKRIKKPVSEFRYSPLYSQLQM